MTNLIIAGCPGSGKGTQAKLLAEKLRIPHISTGDIFRDEMRRKTPLGLAITDSMNAGQYTSDDITNEVVKNRLQQTDVVNGFILDGYPRTINQVDFLDSINVRVDLVVELDLNPELAVQRLLLRAMEQDRGDDEESVIRSRMRTYIETMTPVLERYSSRGVLLNVPAVGKIDNINHNLYTSITNRVS